MAALSTSAAPGSVDVFYKLLLVIPHSVTDCLMQWLVIPHSVTDYLQMQWLVISHFVTDDLQMQWLQTTTVYWFSVSGVPEPVSSLA